MEGCKSHDALKVEIDNVKEDIRDLKEDRKFYTETMNVMRENIVRITTLMEKQDERSDKQDKRADSQDKKIDNISQEISGLRVDMHKKVEETEVSWYQRFLEDNYGKTIKFLMIIVIILLGAKLAGFDISKLIQ